MCGFAGEFRLDGKKPDERGVRAASVRLAHRGPDESGFWSEGPVALGFQRLSILDVERGHQPMRSADGRRTLVYNGEVYNHPALKEKLTAEGVKYKTHCDTETILHLFEKRGEGAVRMLEGMFAFALWNSEKRELILARDPLGIKPLYYHFDDKRLVFASELKALMRMTQSPDLDPAATLDYLAYGFTHSPRTILSSIVKLPPGHLLRLNAHGLSIESYWELPKRPSWPEGKGPSFSEAIDEVERLLIASVRGQLMADVPVGAFLKIGRAHV